MLLIANFVKTLSNCCGYGRIKMGEEMQTCFCSLPVAWRDVACLRTVPTIVIAHTFCASPDTRISYRRCLLIQGYFCAV